MNISYNLRRLKQPETFKTTKIFSKTNKNSRSWKLLAIELRFKRLIWTSWNLHYPEYVVRLQKDLKHVYRELKFSVDIRPIHGARASKITEPQIKTAEKDLAILSNAMENASNW